MALSQFLLLVVPRTSQAIHLAGLSPCRGLESRRVDFRDRNHQA